MCACLLLYEITHYLRDNASPTAPVLLGTPRVSITNLSERRPSLISTTSTDTDAVATPSPSATGLHSLDSKMLASDLRPHLSPDMHSSSLEEETLHTVRTPSLEGGSFEEERSESPQKRVSVYLRVNSALEAIRGRTNSGLKQTVNVKSSSVEASAPSGGQRRSSVSVSVGRRHVSFYEKQTSEQAAAGAPRERVTVGTLRPVPGKHRMKPSHSFQETSPPSQAETSSPAGSLRRPKLHSQGSTASQQRNYNLGAQIQSGITRLARRAFRGRIRRKATTTSPRKTSLIPGSSPSLAPRKRPQRLSSVGPVLGVEDSRRHFKWLEVVEHLAVVHVSNPDARTRHSRACAELVTALSHVYTPHSGAGDTDELLMNTALNLNTLFSSVVDPFLHPRERSGGLEHARGNPLRRTGGKARPHPPPPRSSLPHSVTSSLSSTSSLASLDFSRMRRSIFSSPSSNQCSVLELFLEQDSALPPTQSDASFSRDRKKYIRQGLSGLVHTPFSLLVYAAPILSPATFSSLKAVAWDMILDQDQDLAQAAAMFFLLAAAKEGETVMRDFFASRVESEGPARQREAVLRFSTLWRCRYKVWLAIGEKGQKRFNLERQTEERQEQQTIGYSLPTNLLGCAGRAVPVAPWKALSLCVHDDCQTNPDKCYRATRLAPLKHCEEVSEAVEGFMVSGTSLPLEADSKPTSVFAGIGNEDTAGNININQWEAVEPTLLPPSLLPLITFIVTSLTPHTHHSRPHTPSSSSSSSSHHQPSLNRSELAYEAIGQCMIEDPRLLFRPLLSRFNKLYQDTSDKNSRYRQAEFIKSLKDTLHPLHIILQSFPALPPKAAHYLFNSFIGIITRHTDQPCSFSAEIIQSVLLLLTMVIPSVKGLDLKALKSMLKKESCYTTILTTARIRGTEKINIIDETATSSSRSGSLVVHEEVIDGDDTFAQVIARFKGSQLSNFDQLQKLYFVDRNKDLPVLSTLVVKDHYAMMSDKQYPTFILRETAGGSGREVWSWGDQMNQLFVHKMSEALRVLLGIKLLSTGPDIERGSTDVYNKFAQPNYQFLHQELVALTSFPRQALTSILYEAGPTSLKQHHLRSSNVMLMGSWVQFVLELFICAKSEHDWQSNMVLFLNVVNGALLLYSEDLAILRRALAALVVVASKFLHVFRRQGYEMVIPTLVQVYSSHMTNRLITDALKCVWGQLYLLNIDSNVFVLQAIAATATLLSDEAAKLSPSGGLILHGPLPSQQLNPALIQQNNVRAAFELLQSLDSETAPPDHLNIMSYCPVDQRQWEQSWQPLSLQTTFYLCITVASWNPEAVRGMQVLVFLDHLGPMFLKGMSLPRTSNFVLESMKSLVKGCDAITKPQIWKGDFLSRRETQRTDQPQNQDPVGGGGGGTTGDPLPLQSLPPPDRKTSAVAKIYRRIVNPSKSVEVSEGSAYFSQTNLDKATSNLPPMGHQEYVGEFRRQLHATNQRVLHLSRESLLSLSSKLVLHEAAQLRERSEPGTRVVVRVDSQTTAYLTAIAVQLFKLGGTNEITLTSLGLSSFMESLLPNIEWSDGHFGSFHTVVNRLVKLFRMFCRVRIILAWDSLTTFLRGVTQCIKISPQLAAHEPIFVKLKMLLEVIIHTPAQGVVVGGGPDESSPPQGGSRVPQRRPLLHFAPSGFTNALVKLVSQLLVTSRNAPNPRLEYHLSDLLSQKMALKNAIFPKIILPLCIHLGLREDLDRLPQHDLDYLLQLLDKRVENVLKLSHPPLHPSLFMEPARSDIPADMFCRAIKIICCAFSESFTLTDWSRVAHWISSLSLRRLEGLHPASQSHEAIERAGSFSSLISSSSRRSSRHTSVSSQSNFDSYLAFYKALLVHVYEGLLSVHRIPLFSFIWPLLRQLEAQLCEAEKSVKMENPAQLQAFRGCIERFQALRQQQGHVLHTTRSRTTLLLSYQEEMRTPTSGRRFKRASTTVGRSRAAARHLKRKLSYQQSLPSIGEEAGKVKAAGVVKLSEEDRARKSSESRPTSLKLGGPSPQEAGGRRSVVVMKGQDLKKRPVRSSLSELATRGSGNFSSSDSITGLQKQSQSTSNVHVKKSALKRHVASGRQSPPVPAASPLTSPPPQSSPRRGRRLRKTPKLVEESSRKPPLSQLRDDSKFTSSEFQADVEDFDALSPQTTATATITSSSTVRDRIREFEACTVTTNSSALDSETNTVTVEAEVHVETLEQGPSRRLLQSKETSVTSTSSLVLPPPPTSPRPSSRSGSPSHVRRHSPLPSPRSSQTPPLPPPFSLSPPSSLTAPHHTNAIQRDSFYSQDLDHSSDPLIPRRRTSSSPPPPSPGDEGDSSLPETSPCETETDTDTLLPHQTSTSSASFPLGKALSPTTSSSSSKKRLSFDRSGSGKRGALYLNRPDLEREESDC